MMFIRYNNKLINVARIREFIIPAYPLTGRCHVLATSIERGIEYKLEYDNRDLCICALKKLSAAMRKGWQIVNLSPGSVTVPDGDGDVKGEGDDDE